MFRFFLSRTSADRENLENNTFGHENVSENAWVHMVFDILDTERLLPSFCPSFFDQDTYFQIEFSLGVGGELHILRFASRGWPDA